MNGEKSRYTHILFDLIIFHLHASLHIRNHNRNVFHNHGNFSQPLNGTLFCRHSYAPHGFLPHAPPLFCPLPSSRPGICYVPARPNYGCSDLTALIPGQFSYCFPVFRLFPYTPLTSLNPIHFQIIFRHAAPQTTLCI